MPPNYFDTRVVDNPDGTFDIQVKLDHETWLTLKPSGLDLNDFMEEKDEYLE